MVVNQGDLAVVAVDKLQDLLPGVGEVQDVDRAVRIQMRRRIAVADRQVVDTEPGVVAEVAPGGVGGAEAV